MIIKSDALKLFKINIVSLCKSKQGPNVTSLLRSKGDQHGKEKKEKQLFCCLRRPFADPQRHFRGTLASLIEEEGKTGATDVMTNVLEKKNKHGIE